LEGYTINLSNSARLDICEYYTECLSESARLFNKATEIMLTKGTLLRAPFISKPKMVEFAENEDQSGFLEEILKSGKLIYNDKVRFL
jgi:hypothetical protein